MENTCAASFEGVAFRGTFRDYQQKVLDNSGEFLRDGKVHIVAAPGSGKTTLGLELIRGLGGPALILSPTVTIRQQWGERFEEAFLPRGKELSGYFSCDLRKPALVTSVTYQALYAAFNRLAQADGEEDGDGNARAADYSAFDLLATLKKAGIRTVCLDEAHHLRSEWQKTLERFLEMIRQDAVVVALTATPPYDSTKAEWERYISVCGEIDDEISIPRLVKENAICPHQDYVYFNYPAAEEVATLRQYRKKARNCIYEVIFSSLFDGILAKSGLLDVRRDVTELVLENVKSCVGLMCMAKEKGIETPAEFRKLLSPGGNLPRLDETLAEAAFQFVLDRPNLFTEEVSEGLRRVLLGNGLMSRRTVCLHTGEAENRALISSIGKLDSIVKIAAGEGGAMGDGLRMLVLTDYIKKEMKSCIGTAEPIDSMGTVPVFEALRRTEGVDKKIAILSGTLVIAPLSAMEFIEGEARARGVACASKPISGLPYCEVELGSSNKHRVAILTEAFQRGHIHIMVGTKSLLGEGWDSPCVNTLVLASFVGSFMLSNQMRGRAIRIDPENPGKVANIWHLVTVEPAFAVEDDPGRKLFEQKEELVSEDFAMLSRRFECFLGPAYSEELVCNGIARADVICPPYDKKGIARINKRMMELAQNRAQVAQKWRAATAGMPEVVFEEDIPARGMRPAAVVYPNLWMVGTSGAFIVVLLRVMTAALQRFGAGIFLLGTAAGIVGAVFLAKGLVKLLRFISPRSSIRTLGGCLLDALREMGAIQSPGAALDVSVRENGILICVSLRNATRQEKMVFADTVRELLSWIDNPRYLLVRKGVLKYLMSFACPAVFAAKKENAEILRRHLEKKAGKFQLVFTRNEFGRKTLLKCRQLSYINRNEHEITGRRIVKNMWE